MKNIGGKCDFYEIIKPDSVFLRSKVKSLIYFKISADNRILKGS